MKENEKKLEHTILIADDSEMNRSLLADMLGSDYNIIEAADGTQALAHLQNDGAKIDLVLLDIVMPNMDGFEVLAYMNRNGWIKDIPVIVISSETSPSCMERAYELGVTDFINRPFDVWIVRRRVMNTLMLASKQKMLVGMVTDQIYKREKMSNLMITILSHIVEFRNGESGMHVLHIRTISEIILKNLVIKTNQYGLTQTDISLISTASALHDIGKIGIPDEILNKPGRFTKEEYEIMKKHSEYGAAMLDDLDFLQDEKLVQYARQICRWHHERYDGKGYPDGLKGDEIPISAQVVALADVYDALTSPRVYKEAYSHEKAIQMIV
ncbi:MAG: response regulator, partial [Anaeroplasmataceae bacterium]|nr:response regulator [Anaeroplasmataceae bacterium]